VVPGKRLTFEQRQTIERCWAAGWGQAQIAVAAGVSASTICREVARNGGRKYGARHPGRHGEQGVLVEAYRPRYSAADAQRRAQARACRPKPAKLAEGGSGAGWLREYVLQRLRWCWSPQQIAGRLRYEYPDQPELWVSAETIYLAIYLQPRGNLKALLEQPALRSGRVHRRPQRPAGTRARFAELPSIHTRPDEVEDRVVPGDHEGDLLIGAGSRSGIATIVERVSRYTTLVALPGKAFRQPDAVADAVAGKLVELPEDLRRSLSWDRGFEMVHGHARFSVAADPAGSGGPPDCAVYFADPHSPWQRGTNENTNGLLRQYFPKGKFDFDTITQSGLDAVADELNNRPRRVLGYQTPAEVFNRHILLATAG
jgi:transposase, IS30 family